MTFIKFGRKSAALEHVMDAGILRAALLEHTSCSHSQTSKAAANRPISAAAGEECDQDKAAITEFASEASRLVSSCVFLPLFRFEFFFFLVTFGSAILHLSPAQSFRLQLPKQVAARSPPGQKGNWLQLLAADAYTC